ncbi:hypothetical protein FHX42_004555 [Saccharopolyspora lacisalsi]|uniref:HNH nuclease domain-containing protein n=1 Tax=Halosaccharopolyspora lacisalsi TaxID=1000566 RepID=A0A839E7A5_9PSEU|nr:HNH endonuclease signature motif containing protein [Halosaccharopolyspora lacisalsi]MBA8827171.1 hypothetical protein [Halosaccharopolyspora lacisalsi]
MDDGSAVVPGEMSSRELLDGLPALRWSIERMEARLLEQLAEIDRRRAYEEDGAVTAVAWLRSSCRLDSRRAGQLVRLARAGGAHPELRDAQLRGDISGDEAQRISRGTETYHRDLQRRGASENVAAEEVDDLRNELIETAIHGEGSGGLRRTIDSRRHRLAASSMAFDEWAAFQQRELHFYTTFDGMVDVRGTLDPGTAATVRSAIEALNRLPSASNELTAAQRRADALAHLAKEALDRGDLPRSEGQRPHVTVTVSERTLRDDNSRQGALPGELRGQGPCSGDTARLFACDGEVTRLVHGPDSEPTDLGRATRVISKTLRKALDVRDGGCVHSNCDRPPDWCDAHHVKHWAQGGRTDLDNLVLLCRRHHVATHLKGGPSEWRAGKLVAGELTEDHKQPGAPVDGSVSRGGDDTG